MLAARDKITIVSRGRLLPAYVNLVGELCFRYLFAQEIANTAPARFLDHADEGKAWIRGHHTTESDAGKALLATTALDDDRGLSDATFAVGTYGPVPGVTIRKRK